MSNNSNHHHYYSKKQATPRVASHHTSGATSTTATATPGSHVASMYTPAAAAAAPMMASTNNHYAALVTGQHDAARSSTMRRHRSHDSGTIANIDDSGIHHTTPHRPLTIVFPPKSTQDNQDNSSNTSSVTDEDHDETLDQDQRQQLTQDMWQDTVDMDQILWDMRLSQVEDEGGDESHYLTTSATTTNVDATTTVVVDPPPPTPQEERQESVVEEPVTKRPKMVATSRRQENHDSHNKQQPTMSQFYSYTTPAPVTSNDNNNSNNNNTVSNSNLWRYAGRDFMVKDTWTSSAEPLKDFYFCLSRRDSQDRQKAVIGPVHMHLEHTFIGRMHAHRFIAHRRRRKNKTSVLQQQRRNNTTPQHHHDKSSLPVTVSHPEMIRYASKGHLLKRGRLPLSVLTTRHASESVEGTIQTDLIYEKGGNSSNNSSDKIVVSGFTCAYTFVSAASKPLLLASMESLELFAGCQGLGKGFSLEGLNTTHAVELDRSACDTIRRNAPSTLTVWNEDVRRWLKNCQDGRLAAYPKKGQFGFLHWSPPCQGSSNANRTGGMNDNANNSLTPFGVDVVRFFEPPFFTMEQVMGILNKSRGRREILQKTMTDLLLLDYQVRLCVVNAAHYGDAQNRERVLLFGAKRGYKLPDFPSMTHGDTSKGLLKVVTVQDALGLLESISPVPDNGLVELPDGTRVHDHCLNASPSEHKSNVCTLVANKPAPTVRRTNAIRHYNPQLDRLISIRESALLQGFPLDYTFCGDHKSVRDQIGNAVPVNLARAIARSVLAAATHPAQC